MILPIIHATMSRNSETRCLSVCVSDLILVIPKPTRKDITSADMMSKSGGIPIVKKGEISLAVSTEAAAEPARRNKGNKESDTK